MMNGFRIMGARRPASVTVDVADEYGAASVHLAARAGMLAATVGGATFDLGAHGTGADVPAGARAFSHAEGGRIWASVGGLSIEAIVSPSVDAQVAGGLAGAGAASVVAPLPGVVSDIRVRVGDRVRKGEAALQTEAMKLIHTVEFGRDGTVSAVHCPTGDTVPAGTVLVEMAKEGE